MDSTYITTKGGERWDTITEEAYGNMNLMPDLMMANRNVPLYDVFPAGVIVVVPIIETSDTLDVTALPPWYES